ncbi:DUF882 domain-containing protein [Agarivorans sp. TSD2052]|uniref:DUF882 domain-containing protein n=1 Tax=Agarivorans sp. TSD2052 TaxID=2937286 RepID=UPI00200E929C|nr:DUF882 domain-containing protein [Agarivorans sp. TSD2052]UPW17446.1 DUF882 domain-containing protein [Agarivorans sp. TSD2052]
MLDRKLKRRSLLLGLGAGFIGLGIPKTYASSSISRDIPGSRILSLNNLHTNESCEVCFWKDGQFQDKEVKQLDTLLRDFRRNESIEMDRALYMQMALLQDRLGGEVLFQIISGYRSPATNEMLRGNGSGVAKKSFHMTGQAIDIKVKGVSLAKVHKEALALGLGGVGYYPSSGFIHIDTGHVRSWRGS